MKIAIIAAMKKEQDLLLNLSDSFEEQFIKGVSVYKGRVGCHEIILSQCGIGKVNSALNTSFLISAEHPDLIINSGVAGGVDVSMNVGDILIADKVCYHDVWCGPGTDYGQADGCPLFFKTYEPGIKLIEKINLQPLSKIKIGLICSGDKFITAKEEVEEIKSRFPNALGCDMESASIAQCCYRENVPFMIVRIMSDRPGSGSNLSEYVNFWNEAPEKTFEVVKSIINSL